MTGLDWEKTRAQRRAANYKHPKPRSVDGPPPTAKQLAYIADLQRRLGTHIPAPTTRATASNVIEFLVKASR